MTYPAVILAGGRSSRMGGGDKCLLPLGDSSILQRIIGTVALQTSAIAINSNGDPQLFASTGLNIIPDLVPERPGPLAGIHAAMDWALARQAHYVLTVAGDTPFLPRDLMFRLSSVATGIPVIATSGKSLHPVIGLWPTSLAQQLGNDLFHGTRKVRSWLEKVRFATARFDERDDPFRNVNTLADYAACVRQVSAKAAELDVAGNHREGMRYDAQD